jgi:IS5 family transposase
MDSRVYSWFCRIGIGKPFRESALQHGIKSISDSTWEQINRILLGYAGNEGIERGRKVRVDCTVVESNIHAPYDSELLLDSIRVLSRTLTTVKIELPGLVFSFSNHLRSAKRRNIAIMNAKNAADRKKMYKDLVLVTENTIVYAEGCLRASGLTVLPRWRGIVKSITKERLEHFLPLVRQVVCQTRRRVFEEESVPASEKIISIFEEHTDIIRKDRRDTYYGHKICLTSGASTLILDCVVLKGNPADSELTETMLERQNNVYGRYPLKAAFDGGFSSQDNLKKAREKKGLKDMDMCRSNWIYRQLQNFRAGIESGISWLKRSLGLDRCLWKGLDSFKSYVWASIVSDNLLTLVRHQLA